MNNKILLVDDEPDILEFLDYNLTKEGFNVLRAHDGEEALEKIIENPDLIVLEDITNNGRLIIPSTS